MKKSIRRLLSITLALVLTVGLFPGMMTVHAAEVSANGIDEQDVAVNETADGTGESTDTVDGTANGTNESNDIANEGSRNVDAYWTAIGTYYDALEAFQKKNDEFWEKYGQLIDSGQPLSEAQWNEIYQAWKPLPKEGEEWESLKAAYIEAYEALELAYNTLTEEEKELPDEYGNTPKNEFTEIQEFYPEICNTEPILLPESPYLQPYLDRLDADNGVYHLLGAAGDAMVAFDDANAAYQEELDKENPDSAALDSLYKAAMEKYNELIAAENALEKEYKALGALYQKIPPEEKAIVWDNGNGVSIEWEGVTTEITEHRNNMKDKIKPTPLGKNVKEDILPGAPSTKLVYTDKDALLACIGLSDEEKSKASVEVVFQAAPKSLTQAESELTASKLPNGYKTGCALDLSMYLNLNGTKARDITKTASPVSVSVTIPQDLINTDTTVTRTYKIVRIHDNDAQVLDGTYNPQDHTFTFSTDCFSTYVIIYKDDKTVSAGTQQPGNTNSNQSAGTSIKAPKTGDNTPLAKLFAGMISSLFLGMGSIGFYVWRRKKKLAR